MGTDIVETKFDPHAAVDAIRVKIRLMALEVIPSEQWEALIRAELNDFMEDKWASPSYRSDERKPSGFKLAVRSILEEEAKKAVKAYLSQPEWADQWSNEKQKWVAGEAVQDLLRKEGPAILETLIRGYLSQSVSNILERVRNS